MCGAQGGRASVRVRTIIGALFGDGRTACMTSDAATDGEIFYQYVVNVLIPELRPGDIVVLGNLRFHKQQRTLDAIQAAGARVGFLPPCSPDLYPIQKMWSKFKAILRKLAARTSEALDEAILVALNSITSADASAWLASCAYSICQPNPYRDVARGSGGPGARREARQTSRNALESGKRP